MILPRFIPPAGTVINSTEIFGWIFDTLTGKDRRAEFCDAIKSKYKVKHCFLMSSGRAAMAMLFKILKQKNTDPLRCEIILPSYTCYSVPAAAEIAGLKVRICDIDPTTLSYDLEQFKSIDFSRVLCVVTANLYGYPDDLPQIESIARENGCYLLDDAAQSMNAKIENQYSGTFGDIGLYSLDKGKNITSMQGGIIVTNNDELALDIETYINNLPVATFKQQINDAIKLCIYSILLKPYLYWIPANIPALGLGKTIYTTDYLFCQYSRSMSALAIRLFKRIDKISRQRKDSYNEIYNSLNKIQGIDFIKYTNKISDPVFLRTPVLINDVKMRNNIISELNKNGIGATVSYPESIANLDQLKSYSIIHNNISSAGEYVANHIITLPGISYLNSNDINKIGSIFLKYSIN